MPAKLTTALFVKLSQRRFGDAFRYDETQYVNAKTPVALTTSSKASTKEEAVTDRKNDYAKPNRYEWMTEYGRKLAREKEVEEIMNRPRPKEKLVKWEGRYSVRQGRAKAR
jgi:hypothetical protein